MKLPRNLLCMLALCVLVTATFAQQQSTTSLTTIMQALRNDTVVIMDAMLVDDLASVADAAVRIANHARIPPDQVVLVAAELGSEMAAFRQFDTSVHDSAVLIREAAQDNDRVGVQESFEDMMAGCLGCHAAYRQRVMSVLRP